MKARTVPLIDVDGLYNDENISAKKLNKIAREIEAALVDDLGFFQIVNHNVDEDLIADMTAHMRTFFAKPQEYKDKLHRHPDNSRGYFKLMSELTKRKPDWKEGFDYGDVWDAPAGSPFKGLDGINQWPADYPEFEQICNRYMEEMRILSLKLVGAISLSLGLPERYIEDTYLQSSSSFTRLNHYPAVKDTSAPGFGVHHHTDAGILTLLLQDDVGGLEVKDRDAYIGVTPTEGAYVVNIGDMLQVWSNDRYRANLHRVRTNIAKERYSIPFFYNPAPDVTIQPLDVCISAERPALYKPINFGDFRYSRAKGDMGDYGPEVQISHYRFDQDGVDEDYVH